jgi:hypothetical protein
LGSSGLQLVQLPFCSSGILFFLLLFLLVLDELLLLLQDIKFLLVTGFVRIHFEFGLVQLDIAFSEQ